jgi:hypothetical protein
MACYLYKTYSGFAYSTEFLRQQEREGSKVFSKRCEKTTVVIGEMSSVDSACFFLCIQYIIRSVKGGEFVKFIAQP